MLMVDEIEGMAEVDFRHKLEELAAEELARLSADPKALSRIKPPLLSLSEARAVLDQVMATPPAPAVDQEAERKKALRRERDRARRARKKAEAAAVALVEVEAVEPPSPEPVSPQALSVMPAQAGIHECEAPAVENAEPWAPACAGATEQVTEESEHAPTVMPAPAGIHGCEAPAVENVEPWAPACAGATDQADLPPQPKKPSLWARLKALFRSAP